MEGAGEKVFKLFSRFQGEISETASLYIGEENCDIPILGGSKFECKKI